MATRTWDLINVLKIMNIESIPIQATLRMGKEVTYAEKKKKVKKVLHEVCCNFIKSKLDLYKDINTLEILLWFLLCR